MPRDYADLKSLQGVEIFATGKWNGDNYSKEDLESMVESFTPLKETLQPFVKLGHNEKQGLLAKDGMPAAGWIDRIYIEGNKLLADIVDMPATIYELVKNKAYKRVSSEIYWNLKDSTGKVFKRALKAIALLGGDTPAVGSLADVQALYAKRNVSDLDGDIKTAEIEFYTKEDIMEVEKLKAEHELAITKLTADHKAALQVETKKYSDLEAENKKLVDSKKDSDARIAKFELDSLRVEAEKKVAELISKKKVLPAQKEYMIETLLKETDIKTYADKKDKVFDESPLIKIFENGADVVDTDEKTADEQPKEDKEKEEEIAKEVENAADYAAAKKAYMKGDK